MRGAPSTGWTRRRQSGPQARSTTTTGESIGAFLQERHVWTNEVRQDLKNKIKTTSRATSSPRAWPPRKLGTSQQTFYTCVAKIATAWSTRSLKEDVLHLGVSVFQRLRDWRRLPTRCSKNKLAVYRCSEKDSRDFFQRHTASTAARSLGFSVVVLCTSPPSSETKPRLQGRAVNHTKRKCLSQKCFEGWMRSSTDSMQKTMRCSAPPSWICASACLRFTNLQRTRPTSQRNELVDFARLTTYRLLRFQSTCADVLGALVAHNNAIGG